MATQFVVRDILRQAWSLTPMLGIVDTADDNEMRKALGHLRLLLDERNNDGWFQYKRPTVQFTLGGGVKTVTIGTDAGNDIVTNNTPNSIFSARLSYDSGQSWEPLGILTDYVANDSADFRDTLSQSRPTSLALYRDDGDVSNITFNNVPDQSYLIQLEYDYSIENIDQNTVLSMPPGYQSYFVYTIAHYLSSEAKDPNPFLEQRSIECYKKICRANMKLNVRFKNQGFSAVSTSSVYGTVWTNDDDMIRGPVR